MASPISTYIHIFDLKNRRHHDHPEINYFTSGPGHQAPDTSAMDEGTNAYVERLRDVKSKMSKDNETDHDMEAA